MKGSTYHRNGRLADVPALALLLVGLLFAIATGAASAQGQSPFGEGVVTATTTANLNIRSAPGTDAEILATLPSGTVVGFTGFTDPTGEWVQVDAADGPVGWVWAAHLSNVPGGLTALTAAGVPVQPPAAAEEFGEDVVTTTTTANLNLRNAPGTDAEILATLPSGSVVGFTGFTDPTGDWVQVDAAAGPVGWVTAAHLSSVPGGLTALTAAGTPVQPPAPAEEFSKDVVTATTTANLNIRSAPNTDGEILAVLPSGTVVGFTGLVDPSGNWVQVDAAGGPVGWVWAASLSNVPAGLTVWSSGG